jgi:hypothetical protein
MPYHHYRQTRTNSCGASSLLCAALELGTTQLPSRPAWPLWTNAITLDTNLACELTIYSVTCGGAGLPPAQDAGYSLPSYIFEAATAMGRQATAYVPSSLVGTALTTLYSGDVDRARAQGMTIHRQQAPTPGPNERLLRVMRVGENVWYKPALGLHYIMERPDGSLMDPALGLTANSLAALQEFQGTQGASYVDTGIGIIIA